MNAVFATKPGGTMILTLDCPDIKEPAIFTDWFFRSDMEAFERDLRADFSIPAFVAFKSHCIFRSMKAVYVVTRPENFDIIRHSGLIPAATLERRIWRFWIRSLGKSAGRSAGRLQSHCHGPRRRHFPRSAVGACPVRHACGTIVFVVRSIYPNAHTHDSQRGLLGDPYGKRHCLHVTVPFMLYGYTFYHIYYVCACIKMTKLYIFFLQFPRQMAPCIL